MRKMQRIAALGLAGAMALSLAACGGSGDSTASTAESTASSTEAAADGYTTTSENATGTIECGKASEASFTNARTFVLPLSGMGGIGPMLLAGLVLLVAAAVWVATRKLRFAPIGKHSEGQGDKR